MLPLTILKGTQMEIVIASLRTADRKIAHNKPDAVISIGSPGGEHHCSDPPLGVPFLKLAMRDTVPMRSRRPLPRESQIRRVIEFTREARPTKLLVHCKAGRSRSTACALVALAASGVDEAKAVKQLLEVAPKSDPNGWILCLGDLHLHSQLFKAASTAGIVKW